jgi:hypothetical protein
MIQRCKFRLYRSDVFDVSTAWRVHQEAKSGSHRAASVIVYYTMGIYAMCICSLCSHIDVACWRADRVCIADVRR